MRFFLLALAAFLLGCSDESALFDIEDADVVSVKAYVVRESDSTRERRKADTISPNDSIVLLAVIEPTRSIRMTEFHWQIDSGSTHSEFSHRTAISSPGRHLARFTLLDRFSDTLRDSVILWVAPPPQIDTESWIPRNGTQDIPPDSEVSFAWNASAENILALTRYAFSLRCGGKVLLDTVLSSTSVTYRGNLPEQELCRFDVSASDDFGNRSPQEIHSLFLTGKVSEKATENVFLGIRSPVRDSLAYRLASVSDEESQSGLLEDEGNDSIFSIRNVKPGTYRLFVQSQTYPDYTSDTVILSVQRNKALYLESLAVRDTVAPRIRSRSKKDTIAWEDTLRFDIEERGLPVSTGDIRVIFDGSKVSGWTLDNGELLVFTQDLQPSLAFHPLTISVTDRAQNSATENFLVAPGKSCVQTLSDTTLFPGESLAIPIENACPHLLPKRFFWDIDSDGHWDGEADFDDEGTVSKTFSHSLFQETGSKVLVEILYASGEAFDSEFFVTLGGTSP